MLRFGLLGAGRIGQIHGGNIAALAGCAGWSRSPTSTPTAAAALAGSDRRRGARSPTIIASAGDIDAVLIGTPTDTHADLIEAGAQGRQGGLLREAGRPRRRRGSRPA